VRVDTHVRSGYEPYYESLICKVITWAPERDAACDRMIAALEQLRCEGVATTVPLHLTSSATPTFVRTATTPDRSRALAEDLQAPSETEPAWAGRRTGTARSACTRRTRWPSRETAWGS
jgi:acetyl/propionyl-CoA carboxylase alpha subunit